jgi:uncharacterized protein
MSGRAVYIDSSAFIKLVIEEPETTALRSYLRRRSLMVAAALLRTEVLRASMRISQAHVANARRLLPDIGLIEVDRSVLERAGELTSAETRSLDAIHVAAALSLGDDIDEFVTYDRRLLEAAREWGLVVASPS